MDIEQRYTDIEQSSPLTNLISYSTASEASTQASTSDLSNLMGIQVLSKPSPAGRVPQRRSCLILPYPNIKYPVNATFLFRVSKYEISVSKENET